MSFRIIILAGGKGARMNCEDLPKVLVQVNAQPMIEYAVAISEALGVKPIVVTGFKKELIDDYLGERVDYVFQEEQLGTGHAVLMVKDLLKEFSGQVLVMYGDHPLIKRETLEKLIENHKDPITIMTTTVEDYDDWRDCLRGFGKIIKKDQLITAIREVKDCNDQELEIKELNPGYYCFDSQWLWANIDKLKNENSQSEYYLTDLIDLAVSQGYSINSVEIEPVECLGVNTLEQLKKVEELTN
jgi:bifunctional UDP-N-acetylglucosamine pyrophosphorylase / glucosamine-1-phosphate N-acetyltransferase